MSFACTGAPGNILIITGDFTWFIQSFSLFCLLNHKPPPENRPILFKSALQFNISKFYCNTLNRHCMSTINRLFDSITTVLFILWIFFNLFERHSLSQYCIAAMLLCFACVFGIRLFINFKIMLRRLKQ